MTTADSNTDVDPYTPDGYSDPYPDAPAGAGIDGTSDLDRLRYVTDKKTSRTVDFPVPRVPGRENVTLRMQVGGLTGGRLQSWQKTARRRRRDEADGFLFNSLVVANQCEAILINGRVMHDPDGDPYTFRSADFIHQIGVQTAAEAAVKFVGSDGVIASLSQAVLEEAGFGSEDDLDPTPGG